MWNQETIADLERAIANYRLRKWDQFGASVAKYWPYLPTDLNTDRDRALYLYLETGMMGLACCAAHERFISSVSDLMLRLGKQDAVSFCSFVLDSVEKVPLRKTQLALSDLVPRFFAKTNGTKTRHSGMES